MTGKQERHTAATLKRYPDENSEELHRGLCMVMLTIINDENQHEWGRQKIIMAQVRYNVTLRFALKDELLNPNHGSSLQKSNKLNLELH